MITALILIICLFLVMLVMALTPGHYQAKRPTDAKVPMRLIYEIPILFVFYILKIRLFSYQTDIISCKSKRIVILAGRQIGKTFIIAIIALFRAISRPNQTILIVAPTLRQSRIPYERIRDLIESIPFLKKLRIKDTLSETKFTNGSIIHVLPAGRLGHFLTGFPADLVIYDEAAFIPDPVFQSLGPSIAARGGDIVMSGTPYGEDGRLYDVVEGEPKRPGKYKWKKYRIPSINSPLIDEDFLEDERESMTEAEFKMWYEAEFISETDEFFPKVQLKKLLRDYDYIDIDAIIDMKPGDRIIGMDISRFGTDETAAVVVERLSNHTIETIGRKKKLYKVIWRGTKAKTSIPYAADWGRELLDFFGAKMIVVDATGLGGGVFDLLESEFGERVEGVTFAAPIRKAMYNTLKIAIERENLILNMDDKKMLKQFGSFTLARTASATGELQIKKSTSAHDDLPDALALAIWGFEQGRNISPMDPHLTDELESAESDTTVTALEDELREIRRLREIEKKVDAELSAKNIDETEAERRKRMKRESDFWGI